MRQIHSGKYYKNFVESERPGGIHRLEIQKGETSHLKRQQPINLLHKCYYKKIELNRVIPP